MEENEFSIKVTVLIVSYNCVAALRRCLEALERSAGRESMELLVVDNGSQDESAQVDQEYVGVTILRIPRNFGLTKARNIGVRTAKGDYILLLDPEVEVAPDTISGLINGLESDPSIGAVCPLLVDLAGRSVSQSGKLPAPNELYRWWKAGDAHLKPLPGTRVISPNAGSPLTEECPDPRAVLVRRLFVKGMNYFDEHYGQFGSNLELFVQVRRAAKKIAVLPDVKAVCHSADDLWRPTEPAAKADIEADYASGIIAYAGKHYGWGAGLKLRILSILRALFGLRIGVLTRLVSGQKIDGSQTGM